MPAIREISTFLEDRTAGYQLVRADICDADAVAAALHHHRPRAIVHFAAESHVDRSIVDPFGAFIHTKRANGTLTRCLSRPAATGPRSMNLRRARFDFCTSPPTRSTAHSAPTTLHSQRPLLTHPTALTRRPRHPPIISRVLTFTPTSSPYSPPTAPTTTVHFSFLRSSFLS